MNHPIDIKKNSAGELSSIMKIIFVALFLRLFLACVIPIGERFDDVSCFILPWMKNMAQNEFWSMYKTAEGAAWAMDYPPLYYAVMYLVTGKFAAMASFAGYEKLAFVLCRSFPLIVDMLFIYILAKFDKKVAWTWALALPAIFDIGGMGQSDCVLILEAFLLFYFFLEKKNLKAVSIMYALMACTKLQGLYFLPIFLGMVILHEAPWKEKIKDFSCGVLVGAVIWLPWLIVEGPQLFFKIYLGSYHATKILYANAGNLWMLIESILGFNNFTHLAHGDLLYQILSYSLLFAAVLILYNTYKKTNNYLFASAFYLFFIFMFTLQQRERYEMYCFGLIIAGSIWFKDFNKIKLFVGGASALQIMRYVLGSLLVGTNSYIAYYAIYFALRFAFLLNLIALFKFLSIKIKLAPANIELADEKEAPYGNQ